MLQHQELYVLFFVLGLPPLISDTAHVEVPASLLTPPANPAQPAAASTSATPTPGLAKEKQKKKHHLTTATDPLLAELRDLNFAHVGRKLNQVARRLDEDYKVGRTSLEVGISLCLR